MGGAISKCFICYENIGFFQGKKMLECGHVYHEKCIGNMSNYKNGDFIIENKHQCPECRHKIKLNKNDNYHKKIRDSHGYLKAQYRNCTKPKDNKGKYYRFCNSCKVVFEAGDMDCQVDKDQLPNLCLRCDKYKSENRIKKCMGCSHNIEWISGCCRMTCTKCSTQFCFLHNRTQNDIGKLVPKILKHPFKYKNGDLFKKKYNRTDNYSVYSCPDCIVNGISMKYHLTNISVKEINDAYPLRVTKIR